MANCMRASVLFLLALPWTVTCDKPGSKFLEPKMSAASIRAQLQGVLGEVLGQGHGVGNARLNRIRKVLAPLFQAMPKNKKGNVAQQVMRYVVRRYFSQQHAWIVKGFEPHADIMNVSAEDVTILQGKVPEYIRSVLENQFQHEGFAFEDTVAMVAALERLSFDEVVKAVEQAFYLNSFSETGKLTREELMEVMSSYLINEMLEGAENKDAHIAAKQNIRDRYPNWDGTYMFLVDVVSSDLFEHKNSANPFIQVQTYDFEDAVRMAGEVGEQFGPWSNHECHEMRNMLTQLDVHNTGRVKISDFYRSTVEGAWQFLEPTEFLRQNGALDESSKELGQQVIIANYITGMSNCITSAPYYSICCLNDCDNVYQHIESRIPSSTASTLQIVAAVQSLPQGADITFELQDRLEEIASLHDGQVPVHGRLLAQWLHFVFPHECPYPHLGGLDPKTQEQWRAQVGEDAESVSEDEVRQHFEAETSRIPVSKDAGKGMWVLHETLMQSSTPSDDAASVAQVLRIAAQLTMLGAFVSLAIQKVSRLVSTPAKSSQYDV